MSPAWRLPIVTADPAIGRYNVEVIWQVGHLVIAREARQHLSG